MIGAITAMMRIKACTLFAVIDPPRRRAVLWAELFGHTDPCVSSTASAKLCTKDVRGTHWKIRRNKTTLGIVQQRRAPASCRKDPLGRLGSLRYNTSADYLHVACNVCAPDTTNRVKHATNIPNECTRVARDIEPGVPRVQFRRPWRISDGCGWRT